MCEAEWKEWQCRQPVVIDNTRGATELTDYQVRVELTAPLFDFTMAAENGADLRFTDSDRITALDYWIESFDRSGQNAVVWVKVPQLAAGVTKTIHVLYGNPLAQPASDGNRTFEFFDDCERGSPEDKWEMVAGEAELSYVAYEEEFARVGGVWHMSDCTRRLSPTATTVYGGAHATYCAWTRPMAVYAPSVDRTFFAFGNEDNCPAVSYYDHRTKTLGPATVVGTNPDMDAHENPHMLIDEDGFIYVFHGSHCTPSLSKKSVRPYDSSEWAEMATITDKSSYPQPWQLKPGEITVLFRKNATHDAAQSLIRSTDGCESWAKSLDIVTPQRGNGVYAVSIAENGAYPRKVHMAWSLTRGDWWQRYHVFYAYSDDGGVTWKKRDGSSYQLPITEPTSEMIYESDVPDRGVWLKDIQLDSRGNPNILFIDANTLTYEANWKVATYSDDGWAIYEITHSDHMFDHGALVFLADDDLRLYAPTTPSQPYEDGGEMEEWQSTDGGRTWTNIRHLTTGSQYSHNHAKTVFNHGRGDFRVFWSYGDAKNPPSTYDVELYYYGEQKKNPKKMELRYDCVGGTGKLLRVSQPDAVEAVIRTRGLSVRDAAICARAKTGPPDTRHSMMCLAVSQDGHFHGGGLARGKGAALTSCDGQWHVLAEGKPQTSTAWRNWSFGLADQSLQLVVDGEELLSAEAPRISAGGLGMRVFNSSFYLDDIRVRKFTLPEPTAAIQDTTEK